MKLSIIIPAHNEEATIGQVLEKVLNVNLGQWEKEIIAVDDGSTDSTGKIIEQWASLQSNDAHCAALHHKTNLGKGAAIRAALKEVTGDYIIIQDADAEYDPGDIAKLLSVITPPFSISSFLNVSLKSNSHQKEGYEKRGKIAVFGARGYKAYPERGFHYVIGAWMLTTFYNLLYNQRLTDLYTGYKLISSSIFKSLNIQSAGFEFEAEVACKLAKANVKIQEVSISYKPRNKSQGKHIGWIDAIKGFWKILRLKI